MKEVKNYLYTIKNIKTSELILNYVISEKKFILLDKNATVINDNYISKFELQYINNNTYYLIYKYNYKKYFKKVKFVFSSKNLENPLFFNIYVFNNNKYEIIKSNCDNILCKTHYIINKPINEIKFKSKADYIFYLSYLDLQPCRIKMNNNLFNVLGYTKTPNLNNIKNNKNNKNTKENFNITCNVNRDLENSWRVKYKNKCKYIYFKDNKYNKKLKDCSVSNKFESLLTKLPSVGEILKQMVKKQSFIKAGQQQDKIDKAKNIIDDKIGDRSTRDAVDKLEKTLSPAYKEVLAESLNNFSKLDKDTLTKDNYIILLKDIYEKNKEYNLIGKYKICKGVKLTNICNIENIVECQKKCNQIYDCAHLSYDRKQKKCRLFNTCKKLKDSFNNMSYTKQSLLRNNGYNINNSYLLYRNPPISEMPTFIRLLTFVIGIIIIVSFSMIMFKIIKAFIKLFMCSYYGTCYSPVELLNIITIKEPTQKYI